MKSVLIRSFAMIIIGCLLLAYANQAATWLVILIGCLFLAPGIYSLYSYWSQRNQQVYKPFFPIVGTGSTLLGIIMVFFPHFFATSLMVALGCLLVVASLAQFYNVIKSRRIAPTPIVFYFMPAILLVCGSYVLSNINEVLALPFYVAGAAMIIYGLEEIVHYFWLKKQIKNLTQQSQFVDVEDAVVVSETSIENK